MAVKTKRSESMLLQWSRVFVAACFLLAIGRSQILAESEGSARLDPGMPEHLARQVAPAPSAPWTPPDLSGYTKVLKSGEASPIDPQKRYSLLELIDIAERTNPETRVAWESARRAAIAV